MGTKKFIKHEMPPFGTVLVHKTRPKQGESTKLFAKVVKTDSKNGVGILCDGKIYRSMTAAARVAGGYIVDGWNYWKNDKRK